MVHIVFSAEIHKSLNSSIGWNILCSRRIDMDQYVAVMSGQKTGGLDGPHIIIGIDTGDVLIFPFNGDNGNLKICQLPGGQRVAQDDESLYLIGQKSWIY